MSESKCKLRNLVDAAEAANARADYEAARQKVAELRRLKADQAADKANDALIAHLTTTGPTLCSCDGVSALVVVKLQSEWPGWVKVPTRSWMNSSGTSPSQSPG